MGRFRYNMQNILGIKEKMETQEKQQFALQTKRLTEEEEKLHVLEAEKERLIEEGKKLRLTKINILDIKENTAAKQYQDELIKKQEAQVKTAQKNREIARIRMQKAIQEREIYEKLKEKAFEEFMAEENRAQAKEIDELTSYVYGKNKTQKP
ncbi:MAG: flagellar export protein FliJ [Lachnospiraceae bacterium]